jgi:transcription antitermination protein NusB
MSARGKARKRALEVLFEADLRKKVAVELLADRPLDDLSQGEYSKELVVGVDSHREKIDEIINTYSEGWDMDRMPGIDRNILRIAIFEILWNSEVDDNVAISQAVEIANELSTVDSGKYINGVLGRVSVLKPVLGA